MDKVTYALLNGKINNITENVDQIATEATEAWLEDNVDPDSGYVLDRTLTMSNAAAPADLVGEQSAKVDDLKSAIVDLQNVVIFTVELSSLNSAKTFFVQSGDTITVKAKDGSAMTVSQIRLVRENNTNDYWTISGYTERTIPITEKFVKVFLSGGTEQTIVVEKTSSYLNYNDEIAAIKGRFNDDESKIIELGTIVGVVNPQITQNSGYYIATNGAKTSSANFAYSDPIQVYAGQKVSLVGGGYNTSIAMISTCDSDGTNIEPKVICTDSNLNTYEYDVVTDGYVIVCYSVNKTHSLTIYTDKIGDLEKNMTDVADIENVVPSNLNVGYIGSDGRIMDGSNFRYTNPIRLENETIEFTAKGYLSNVSMLTVCDENGGNRISLVYESDGNPTDITYTSNGVNYVIISSGVTVPIVYRKVKIKNAFDKPYVCLSLFNKFGVIGDSYASGTLFFNSTYKEDYTRSWGQIMARNLGTTCTNYSTSGLTTRTWLTNAKGLSLLLDNDPEEIYYLVLGINDSYSLGLDYLGTIEDITGYESYTQYPDTFYGNYGKIIEQIQGHATHAKIVMFTIASTLGNNPAFSTAIKEIAEHYEIPCVDQNDDPFFTSAFYNNTKVEGHPIAITYSGMASAFERLLNECIKNNVAYFKDAFCYAD